MQLALQHNMEVIFFLIFLFYVIKEKAALELEGDCTMAHCIHSIIKISPGYLIIMR